MSNFLSIDPSLTGTGYVIMNTEGEIITYGDIATHTKTPIEQRLYTIYTNIDSIIVAYQPTAIIIEKMFVNMNGKSSMNIAAVRGILLLLCGQHNIPVTEIIATTIRRIVVGKGNATKPYIKQFITQYLAGKDVVLNKPSHNIIDALAVALYYLRTRL